MVHKSHLVGMSEQLYYHVSREAVTELDLDDVTESELLSLDVHFLSVANAKRELWNQFPERLHDFGRFVFLIERPCERSNFSITTYRVEFESYRK